MDFRATLVGLLVGTVVGLTGIGSGTLTMPLLVLWMGVPPLQAVGSDLVYATITKAVGTWQHSRLGNVDYRTVALLSVGAVPATVLAALWIARVGSAAQSDVGQRVVGGALIFSAVVLAVQLTARLRGKDDAPRPPRRERPWALGVTGALLGGLVGATSVGAGSFGTALLTFFSRMDARKVVGTMIAQAMVLSFFGSLTHLAFGDVRFDVVAGLLLGGIPGVVIGSRLTVRTPEPVLRGALALVLLALGLRMQLPREHAHSTPVAVGVAEVTVHR